MSTCWGLSPSLPITSPGGGGADLGGDRGCFVCVAGEVHAEVRAAGVVQADIAGAAGAVLGERAGDLRPQFRHPGEPRLGDVGPLPGEAVGHDPVDLMGLGTLPTCCVSPRCSIRCNDRERLLERYIA